MKLQICEKFHELPLSFSWLIYLLLILNTVVSLLCMSLHTSGGRLCKAFCSLKEQWPSLIGSVPTVLQEASLCTPPRHWMVRPQLSQSSSWIPLYSLLQKSYPPCHTIGTLRTVFTSDPFFNLPVRIQCPTGCSHSINSHWVCEQISVTMSQENQAHNLTDQRWQ